MKRAFKWGNESLHMALLKHSPKNFTGMRKTLARACSDYVQNHKYEKYSQLAFPRQIVNKHSFLTWGSALPVGSIPLDASLISLFVLQRFFLSVPTLVLWKKKLLKYLSLVFNPSTVSLPSEGSLMINVHEGEGNMQCSSWNARSRKFPGAVI